MRPGRPILVVDDDDIDVMSVKRALRELKVTNPVLVAADGDDALEVLADPENRPCLILLDVNMPRRNGIETLAAIKADAKLKTIPVVILTTSRNECHRVQGFTNGVAGYMVKPVEYPDFVEVIRAIDNYWTLCEAPL